MVKSLSSPSVILSLRATTSILLGFLICIWVSSHQSTAYAQEQYASYPDSSYSELTVHLICHSHCDSGWLQTFDEYSYNVSNILNLVTEELGADPNKKFVWSEIGFLKKWWNESASQRIKDIFYDLVKQGRIEFVGGGYVQNDEACPDPMAIINQQELGHKFIRETFNIENVDTAWQIDPFGHSAITPTLYSKMGYKHVVLNRISKSLKEAMKSSQQLQFIWRGNPALGESSQLFAHVLDDHYSAPDEFSQVRWDSGYDPSAAQRFLDMTRRKQHYYGNAPHLMLLIGDDFTYQDAPQKFSLIDSMIKALQSPSVGNTLIKVKYSTVKEYFGDLAAWANANNKTYNYYDGDFFPYGVPNDWWTGYYTTRPILKGMSRRAEHYEMIAEMLATTNPSPNTQSMFEYSRQQIALSQHHDAITGTSKHKVVNDYLTRLTESMAEMDMVSSKSLSLLFNSPYQWKTLNHTDPISFKGNTVFMPITIVNPTSWKRNEIYSLKLIYQFGANFPSCPASVWYNATTMVDFDCVMDDPINEYTVIRLDFPVELGPMSIKTYYIRRSPPRSHSAFGYNIVSLNNSASAATNPSIENDQIKLTFNPSNQMFLSNIQLANHSPLGINQDLMKYIDYGGTYEFHPLSRYGSTRATLVPSDIRLSNNARYIKEFKVTYHSTTQNSQQSGYDQELQFRIQQSQDREEDTKIDIVYSLHGEPLETSVIKFQTGIASQSLFTDNGMMMMQRFNNPYSEIPESYFPAITYSYIKDDNYKFICFNDRTRGVSSLNKVGVMEMAVHRDLQRDDNKGLGEINNDSSFIHARMQCQLKSNSGSNQPSYIDRKNAILYNHQLTTFYVEDDIDDISNLSFEKDLINDILPSSVYILSFKNQDNQKGYCIRFWNIDESQPVKFDVQNLIVGFTPASMTEYDLLQAKPNPNISSLEFMTSFKPLLSLPLRYPPNTDSLKSSATEDFKISISPNEIKTYCLS